MAVHSGWYIPALGAVLGLGFQTKGPVALLLPGLGFLALLWQRRRQRWSITLRRLLLALALFAVVGFGWFAVMYLRLGPEPLAHFFLRENLERFAAATYDVGRRAWWYYLPAYLAFGPALVPVPGRGQLACVARWPGRSPQPSALGVDGADGRPAQPLPWQDRLLPVATAAPGLPGDRPLLRCCALGTT